MHGGSGAMMAAQEHGWPIWRLDSIFILAILAVQGRHLAVVWPKWRFIPMFSFFLAKMAVQYLHNINSINTSV
jgi:hypothetical protein